ncbi:hypothetical protein Patl1_02744 [Pistacia atlantica]|uniref:Uncharacterized protein n=1 Tax=Pistacia atlantica TaxID=434234 RepID=A0ACC1C977_9ROSI|nr:hypothetical protein Patl1_02744 [Pistacia atlantica]
MTKTKTKPVEGDENRYKKSLWTVEEDKILMDYVKMHGKGQWNRIAKKTVDKAKATQKSLINNVTETQESMIDESFVNSLWNAEGELDFAGTLTMLEFMDEYSLI